jgi:DNA-binding NarL/FixJ family response regulator
LVLLDYRMPEMTGSEAFRELTRIDPSARVILMSGNLSRPEFADLKAEGLQSILRKPCSMGELTLAIREALEVPGPVA